jgi:hypothetical protein
MVPLMIMTTKTTTTTTTTTTTSPSQSTKITSSSILPPFQELVFPTEWEHPDDEMMVFADDNASFTKQYKSVLVGENSTNANSMANGPWKDCEMDLLLPDHDDDDDTDKHDQHQYHDHNGLLMDDSDDMIMMDGVVGPSYLFDRNDDDDDDFLYRSGGGGCGGGEGESCESPTGPFEEFHNSSSGFTFCGFPTTEIGDDDHEENHFLSPLQLSFSDDIGQTTTGRHDQDMITMMATMDDLETASAGHHHHFHDHHGNCSSVSADNDDYNDHDTIIGLPFEERYKATIEKLQASMERSQETRKSLLIQTSKTEKYERLDSVKEILSCIATSSKQVQSLYSSSTTTDVACGATTRHHSI